MFFLLRWLTDPTRLIYHEAWVFFLLLLFALVFRASARANPADGLQRYIAFFFAALALDRIIGVGLAIFRVYRPEFLEGWIRLSHFGLFILEISVFATTLYLLNSPIRQRLRLLLKGWLDD